MEKSQEETSGTRGGKKTLFRGRSQENLREKLIGREADKATPSETEWQNICHARGT